MIKTLSIGFGNTVLKAPQPPQLYGEYKNLNPASQTASDIIAASPDSRRVLMQFSPGCYADTMQQLGDRLIDMKRQGEVGSLALDDPNDRQVAERTLQTDFFREIAENSIGLEPEKFPEIEKAPSRSQEVAQINLNRVQLDRSLNNQNIREAQDIKQARGSFEGRIRWNQDSQAAATCESIAAKDASHKVVPVAEEVDPKWIKPKLNILFKH